MGRVRDAGNKSYGDVRIGSHGDLADEELITIGDPLVDGKVFEWDDDVAVTAGRVLVDIGANAAAAVVNLRDAINAQFPGRLVAYVDPVETETLHIEGADAGAIGNLAFSTTMAHASNIIAAVGGALAAGDNDGNRARAAGTKVVSALDVAAENIMIPTPFAAPILGAWRACTSTGVPKYITDIVKITGTRVQIQKNGATNLAATDKVYLEVWSAE